MRRVVVLSLIAAAVSAAAVGCNRRVFEQVTPTCDVTIASDAAIPAEKAADILVVIDNSGSMQEEQDRLAAAFINDTPSCPIAANQLADFARCDEADAPDVCRFANPSQELLEAPGPAGLADCGFVQVLAAFENDFRIGVITTDVGICDNRVPASQAQVLHCDTSPTPPECTNNDPDNGWGFRPQRGCLQPNGPPGTAQKVIARADLLDADTSNDDIGTRFVETLKNVRTFGSAIERGLDAAQLFLDPTSDRDPSCAGDLDAFLRPDAKLIVIYLTDEEDCSRLPDVGACPQAGPDDTTCQGCEDPNGCEIFSCPAGQECRLGFTEFQNEQCGDFLAHFTGNPTDRCYGLEGSLSPVSKYVDFLKGLKADPEDVSVAVIAGGIPDANGDMQAAGCAFDANQGDVPVGGCFESKGNSNNPVLCPAGQNCCFADSGGRYFELAEGMNGLKDTICVDSFASTMIKIAVFIADVDKVQLAERPDDPALVFVEKAPANSEEFTLIGRINATVCGDQSGWVLEEDGVTVRFCGDARPGPGERVRVRAKGDGAETDEPDACANR